jgi:uncharacterized membrane protein YbhN (UPF0104 family)
MRRTTSAEAQQRPYATRAWLVAAQVSISAGLLFYLLWDIPFSSLYSVATSASIPLVLVGMVTMLFSHWLDAVQMMWALVRQRFDVGSGAVLKINLISMFYSLFLPTMIAAGAIRWYHFARLEQQPAKALAAILFNRVFETLLLVTVGVLAFIASQRGPMQLDRGALMLAALVLVVATHVIAFNRHFHRLTRNLVDRVPLPARLRTALHALLAALGRFDQLGAPFYLKLLALGFSRQIIAIALIMVFVRALDIDTDALTIAWIRSLIAFFTLMPLSIAGLGIREATFVVALGQFGVPAERALMLSVLIFARTVVYGLVGALIEAHRVFVSEKKKAKGS